MIGCSFRVGALDMFPTPVSIQSASAQPGLKCMKLISLWSKKIIITLPASVFEGVFCSPFQPAQPITAQPSARGVNN